MQPMFAQEIRLHNQALNESFRCLLNESIFAYTVTKIMVFGSECVTCAQVCHFVAVHVYSNRAL